MSDLMITEQDVSSFRDKLDEWSGSLDDGERAILQMMMVRAFPESSGSSEPEVEGFRDAASGLATGKRMHNPLFITKRYDKSTPLLPHGTLEQFVGVSVVIG